MFRSLNRICFRKLRNFRLSTRPELLGPIRPRRLPLSFSHPLVRPSLFSFLSLFDPLFSPEQLVFVFRYALPSSSSYPRPALRSSCVPTRFASPTYPRYPRAPRRVRRDQGRPPQHQRAQYSQGRWLGRCVDFLSTQNFTCL